MALDKLLQLANIANIVFVVLVAVVTFLIYYLNTAKDRKLLQRANIVLVALVASTTFLIYYLNTVKDRELEKYRTESTIKITAAEAEADKAMKIAESERLARTELESQVAATEARAAEANAVASQAQRELAKLKEPRTIAPEAQEQIIAALKEFAGQNFGFSVFGDPESLALLRALDAMLKSAGWLRVPSQIGATVVDAAGNTAGTSYDSGVTVFFGPDNPDARVALLALSRALTDAGIPCRPSRTEQLRDKIPKAIIINVGKKP